jgi:PAS domain S-box-containing protein
MVNPQNAPPPHQVWEDDLFRLLVENSKDYAIFIIDVEGRILAWSPGAETVLGYSTQEIIGLSFERIFTPDDIQNGVPREEIRAALETDQGGDERWQVRKDGTRFWANGVMTPLRDEHGQVRGLAKVLRDFTEQKLASDAMRESEERLRVALSAAQMGTWLWTVATDRQTMDENLKRLMGLPPDTHVRTIEDFVRSAHPEDQETLRSAFQRSLHEGTDLSVEFRVTWSDGSVHWLRDQGKVVQNGGGKVVSLTGACVDITERKQLEEALRHRAEQLAEADRRKDEFLAMLGHELRNPLAPIRSVLELLHHERPTGEKLEKAYATIDRQVEQLTRLVDDLLDVSRITRGKIHLHRAVADLASIVNSAVETVCPLVDARSHSLMVSLPIHPVWLEVDAARLAQVLTNLLENAVKYTEAGGKIWLSAEREDEQVVLRVRDSGAGMAPDLLPKVFDLFTQGERSLDRSQGGLGIGLTLVRRLVEMHGGSVEAKSEGPRKGSELIVRLPAPPISPQEQAPAVAPAEARRASEATAIKGTGQPRRVLVVDDNHDVAETLAMLLESLGHRVEMAHDGRRAIEIAQALQPEVVVLDIGLPGMDGYQVAKEIRRKPPLQKAMLIALSGYGQEEDRRRSQEAGFDYHLVKPVSWTVLESLLATPATRRAGGSGDDSGAT